MNKDKEPLLTTVGHQELIWMLTPEEVRKAKVLLAPLLEDFKQIGAEKVAVFAYLIGVNQGYHEMYDENQAKNLAERMVQIHRMGRTHGFIEATLLFSKEKDV